MRDLRRRSGSLAGRVSCGLWTGLLVFAGLFPGTTASAAEPAMDRLVREGYVTHINKISIDLPDVTGEYRYLVLNDSHMICLNEEAKEEDLSTLGDRRESFRSKAGYYPEETFAAIIGEVDDLEVDGVILNGDIVDEASAGNYGLAYSALKKMDTPYIYLQADHDSEPYWMDPHVSQMDKLAGQLGISDDAYIGEEDGFVLMGINNSSSVMTQQQLSTVKPHFDEEKPVILFSHVPYAPKSDTKFKSFVKSVRDRLIYWGGDAGLYEMDDLTDKWLDMIYRKADNPVKAVICGHIHGEYSGKLTRSTEQYVCGPCYAGMITVLRIY